MESDKDEYENQPPQVTLPKGFWMLETEVTQAMWKSVMGENPSHFKGDDLPVEQVSWDDCQEFCHRLSDKIGMTISIPTEAHWEYACQAGVPHYRPLIEESRFNQWAYAYHAGIQSPHPETGDLEVMGWYRENANKVTHPVGQKQANAWGLYDMYGNVGEWCNDYYGDYYPSGTAADPIGPPLGSEHIVRGNSLRRSINACYLYYRESPDHQDYGLGFRVIIMDGP